MRRRWRSGRLRLSCLHAAHLPGLGLQCGTTGDGCGGTLDCGDCTPPLTCGGGGTTGVCGEADANVCQPFTCGTVACGEIGDGCGGTINCGDCAPPQSCGGGGTGGRLRLSELHSEDLHRAGRDVRRRRRRMRRCDGELRHVQRQHDVRRRRHAESMRQSELHADDLPAGGGELRACRRRLRRIIQCGTCTTPDTCGGGGVASVCGTSSTK